MSNKKISIFDMERSNLEFKKSHYVSVSGFSETKPPKYFIEFQNQVVELFNQVFNRLDKIDSRIDNLVSKNNLKE